MQTNRFTRGQLPTLLLALILTLVSMTPQSALAQAAKVPSTEEVAAKLSACTVTVRISTPSTGILANDPFKDGPGVDLAGNPSRESTGSAPASQPSKLGAGAGDGRSKLADNAARPTPPATTGGSAPASSQRAASTNKLEATRSSDLPKAEEAKNAPTEFRGLGGGLGPPPAKPVVVNPTGIAPYAGESVLLASGVSLGKGLIVTSFNADPQSRFRITLPDGEQAEAELCVQDEFSGLQLLESSMVKLPALEIASDSPAIGGFVCTAAGAGIERPVVSVGVVGGTDRALAGAGLPLLLQCDLRTTDTSYGAGVVNRSAQLVGVVVATSGASDNDAWTYAVPARYVARLIEAKVDNRLVTLKRQRPTVGFTLGPAEKEGAVRVERVDLAGPAEKAGIQAGDLVLEADGRKLRSAYQAVDLIMKKQPGDVMTFSCQMDPAAPRDVKVTLGGAVVAGQAGQNYFYNNAGQQVRIGPQLRVQKTAPDNFTVQRGAIQQQEVKPESQPAANPATQSEQIEAALLKREIEVLEKLYARLQEELRRRDEAQAKTDEVIQSLKAEIATLKKATSPPPAKPK